MGNTICCVRHLQEVFSSWMGGSSAAEHVAGTASEDAPSSSSPHLPARSVSCIVEKSTESGGNVLSVEQQIEQSKSYWSILTESDSDFTEEEVEAGNREVFKALESHPTWGGSFFLTFGYDTGVHESAGSLEIGEKFAEGGQAELFHAQVTWTWPEMNMWDREHGREWVLQGVQEGYFVVLLAISVAPCYGVVLGGGCEKLEIFYT